MGVIDGIDISDYKQGFNVRSMGKQFTKTRVVSLYTSDEYLTVDQTKELYNLTNNCRSITAYYAMFSIVRMDNPEFSTEVMRHAVGYNRDFLATEAIKTLEKLNYIRIYRKKTSIYQSIFILMGKSCIEKFDRGLDVHYIQGITSYSRISKKVEECLK